MAKGVNLVVLFGHLAQDPSSQDTTNGGTRTRFRIIVDDEYIDADKKRVRRANGFWVTCFANTAKFVRDYARKGCAVHVRAELRESRYQDAAGKTSYANDIVADEVILCSRKSNRAAVEESVPDPAPPEPPAPRPKPKNPFGQAR